ncbi:MULTISPECIES: hypothetical protein [unclassified Hoeflea]|uniref:hypothetical protein n=1 Tax=unclassified Hoeflea TaxID=2614931 RepID=UPI002AFF4111|nr:hypothetical protein [Hoeflea sp.]
MQLKTTERHRPQLSSFRDDAAYIRASRNKDGRTIMFVGEAGFIEHIPLGNASPAPSATHVFGIGSGPSRIFAAENRRE